MATKYKGLITGILMVMCALVMFYVFKLPSIGRSQYIVWMIYMTGIIWGLLSFKNKEGYHTFKEYFSEGFKIFIVATLIIVVYTFIFYKLNPQIMEQMITDNNELILKEGNKTGPEIQENADKFRSIFIPGIMMTNTMIYLVIGALITLIGAGFLSQKKVQ